LVQCGLQGISVDRQTAENGSRQVTRRYPNVAAEWLVLILVTRNIPRLNIEQGTG
jgi:hypothetical protein